jgi:MFS family permease
VSVLFLVVFVGLLGCGIILPLFPFYAERFGASPEVITWTMALYAIGQIVATPAWGRLGDAWGRRPVLVLTLCGTTLAYVSAGAVGRVLGPGMSGALYAQVGIGAPFAVAAVVMVPALALVALFRAGDARERSGADPQR